MTKLIPAVSVTYAHTGQATQHDELGMQPMQARAFAQRGEQYLLIKSPPASGKSRALMFIALDKLAHQGLKQAIIVVPEKAIGASFNNEPLTKFGFFADWQVAPQWNLCYAPGEEGGKVQAVKTFLDSDDDILICTHATFRFAVERYGVAAFDQRLLAVDEFHHVSANPDNKLGAHLSQFIERNQVHIVAMTGSYFRGDSEAVLTPEDEAQFKIVTYTYYEQLNGYQYLKQLDIGYYFYSGAYVNDIMQVLNPDEKTIIHIPNVNARESTRDKLREVENIIDQLGKWQGVDDNTGFQRVITPAGRVLKIADLVDDEPSKRERVIAALRDPQHKFSRDHVDIIIALGMAKEGFDWIWCQHALTVGYRASLTEIVQIIGRTTRDAPGKTHARFTNLIAEPDACEQAVTEAVNDTLKAIAACLLMEQVLIPRFDFTPKPALAAVVNSDNDHHDHDDDHPITPPTLDCQEQNSTGQYEIQIKGLLTPKTEAAARIGREELTEIITAFVQDKPTISHGLFNEDLIPQELTQVRMGKIIQSKYPYLDEHDQEAVRQRAVAALNLPQLALLPATAPPLNKTDQPTPRLNTDLLHGVRKFATDVRDLDIDLIDRINPFSAAYAVLAKTINEDKLKAIQAIISAKRFAFSPEEAKALAERAMQFKRDRGRLPAKTAADPWERHMAEGAIAFMRFKREGHYDKH
jgi:superfamily II DNA or RNA helicase